MRTSRLLPLSCLALLAAATACGSITDPAHEQTQTVTGALTGSTTVPANAHVALVWRNGTTGGVVVGSDVPIVNGHFSMTLTTPPSSYFFPADSSTAAVVSSGGSSSSGGSDGDTANVAADGGAPVDQSGNSGFARTTLTTTVSTQDTASGQIAQDLNVATAGFVVYADANGNGKLDLEGANASSPDQILGGNSELYLVDFQGGGALDYEKLRDSSGILPKSGFNLAWIQGRWLALDLVELKLSSSTVLPDKICTSSTAPDAVGTTPSSGSGSGGTQEGDPDPIAIDGGAPELDASAGSNGYPDPADPRLVCSPDGRSYSVVDPSGCPDAGTVATPPGLCGGDYATPAIACAGASSGASLAPNEDPPAGWPCPAALDGGSLDDGGSANDGGSPILDAGAGPG